MPPPLPKPISKNRLLLVEGSDEDNFFGSFLSSMGSTNDIQIVAVGGLKNMRSRLELLTKDPGFSMVKKVAVVRDADQSFSSAFESMVGHLRSVSLPVPERTLTFSATSPSVGVFIMPGNGRTGALERICLDALDTQPIMQCVEQYIECAGKIIGTDSDFDKVRLGAYIASLPHARLIGEAARAGALFFQHPAYDDLRSFLWQLIA